MIASAVVSHRALQASYRGLTRAHPSTRPDVEVLVDHLGEHLSALGHPVSPTDPPSRTEGNQTRALARLRAAEATAGADRAAASLVAESGDLARVLASVAACHAQHVALLDDLLETGR